MFHNLQVRKVIMLGGPAPTTVWALICTTYSVSGNKSSIVYNSVLLPKLVIFIPLCRIEYCVITPLGGSGGFHCKVTELELTYITVNERGSLGTKIKMVVLDYKLAVS